MSQVWNHPRLHGRYLGVTGGRNFESAKVGMPQASKILTKFQENPSVVSEVIRRNKYLCFLVESRRKHIANFHCSEELRTIKLTNPYKQYDIIS